MFGRKKIAMILAEFLGTAILTTVVLAVSKSTIGIPYFVGLAAGLTVASMVLVFGVTSGAHLNPAITLGLWSVRRIKTLPAIVYIAAQFAGAMAAYWLYTYFIGQHWPNAGKFSNRVLVAEAAGAFILSLAWAAATFQRYVEVKFAAVVGAAFALAVIVASVASGGFANPAVALGARTWVWGTYVLGPVLGALIGFNLYNLVFAPVSEVKDVAQPAKVAAAKPVSTTTTPAPSAKKSSKKKK